MLGPATVNETVVAQPDEVVYVIVVVPLATPVTTPDALIVATAVVDDDHVPPDTVLDNVDVPPITVVAVPVIVGNAFTVELGITILKSALAPEEAILKVPVKVPALAEALNLIYKVVFVIVPALVSATTKVVE